MVAQLTAALNPVEPEAAEPAPTAGGEGAAARMVDVEAVPIDELLLNSLIKMAGGQKKGATWPSHLPLSELKARLAERMSTFHKVTEPQPDPNPNPNHTSTINLTLPSG